MVLVSEIEKSVSEQKEFIKTKSAGLNRKRLNNITLMISHVLVITGVRRCGKSTLMNQLTKKFDNLFHYFNFEDPRIDGFETSDFVKLEDIFGKEKKVYFFDEIQNVPSWELYIRKLHDRDNKICVTGSNASLLSVELGTRLTGRHIQVELFPFSYVEFIEFTDQKASIESFDDYIKRGGFPDYIATGQADILHQLFRDIINRDIIVRYGIRNVKAFTDIALYLISNVGKEFSLTKIKNTFQVGSVNTVAEYVHWLEDSYVIFTVPRFSWSLKNVTINPKKMYVIDTGFAKTNSLSYSTDDGRMLENAVYIYLRQSFKEIYYFREKGECDFVIKQFTKITHAIQVCNDVNPDNMKREVNGLVEAMVYFELETGFIITKNQEDTLIVNGRNIKLIPAWKWFLEKI